MHSNNRRSVKDLCARAFWYKHNALPLCRNYVAVTSYVDHEQIVAILALFDALVGGEGAFLIHPYHPSLAP
jgi:hypothetical protein